VEIVTIAETRKLGYRRRDNVEHEGYDGSHSNLHFFQSDE